MAHDNIEVEIKNIKVNCIQECTKYSKQQIVSGECKYSKYSRMKASTLTHTHHDFADGKHYHYQCVLEGVNENMRNDIIAGEDTTAIKTHYPYYSGLEELM